MNATINVGIRSFEKSDWYGFAGCEAWIDKDGVRAEPLIHDSSDDYTIVADAQGIQVTFYDEDYEDIGTFHLDIKATPVLARCVMEDILKAFLGVQSRANVLRTFGFIEIN